MKALTLKEKYLYFVKVNKKYTSPQVAGTFLFCSALVLLKLI